MSEWIDTKEQATIIRAALKRSFPGTKFSVRISRYSGGSTVHVRWTDGPTEREVDRIAYSYDGRGFDGMHDHAFTVERHLLADGTTIFAKSNNCYDTEREETPAPEGSRRVTFAGHVSTHRDISDEFRATLLGELADAAEVASLDWTRLYSTRLPLAIGREHDQELAGKVLRMADEMNSADVLFYQLASWRSAR